MGSASSCRPSSRVCPSGRRSKTSASRRRRLSRSSGPTRCQRKQSRGGTNVGAHREVEHAVRVARERGNLLHRRVLPDAHLVLHLPRREAVRRDELVRVLRPHEVADLAATSALRRRRERTALTCEPVSISLSSVPVNVFQNRIFMSAVPPPLARMPCWCGFQEMALIAATCSVKRYIGVSLILSQTKSLLSFPPLASWFSCTFHLRPHTSCRCPSSLATWCSRARTSRW